MRMRCGESTAHELLAYSVGGITYRHYAHRAPLAFTVTMTISPPT
jgi:hypothetical protein